MIAWLFAWIIRPLCAMSALLFRLISYLNCRHYATARPRVETNVAKDSGRLYLRAFPSFRTTPSTAKAHTAAIR